MTHSLVVVVSFLSFLAACGGGTSTEGAVEPTSGERHAIKIHRPFTQGQRIGVEVEANQIARALVQGTEQEVLGITEELKIRLAGQVTVDEVADDGRAAVATLRIDSFVDPETNEAILPPGSVVHARRVDGDLVPELEGGTLTDDQKLLLRLAFPLERPGSRLGDELFGTADPRAVGETWDFNRGYVAQDLREDGFESTETGIGGVVTLTEIGPCGGYECVKLQVSVTAEQASLAAAGGASDAGRGQLNSLIRLELPTDPARPVAYEEATTSATLVGTLQQGDQTVERQIEISRVRRARYTPVE